jgi:hypothetical protein
LAEKNAKCDLSAFFWKRRFRVWAVLQGCAVLYSV